jgi:UDP-N-acetylmuramoyl-L-alanyl-D-glutamate--2,6-diaminopimelate ligase
MLLREVLAAIPDIELREKQITQIRGIAYDSRLVREGYLFVAMKGERTAGTHFLRQALDRGAAAVAAEEETGLESEVAAIKVPDGRRFLAQASRAFFRDPSSQLRLVAITGTNGKTTTSYLVDAVLRQDLRRACVVGTIGNKIGDRTFPTERTTPEASDLMRFLQQAVLAGCTHGVLEVSSHALAFKRVWGTKFKVGVFTNLTPDHLDFHKDMESYFQAKRLLFMPEGENQVEQAVLNLDDPYGRRLADEISCPVLKYGFNPSADIHVIESHKRLDGMQLQMATPAGPLSLQSRLVGRPNLYNIMAATGAALCLGVDLQTIRLGIEALPGIPGRMETIDAGQLFTVIVDYAHTPDALENILATIRDLPHCKVVTVFGCGGDRDRQKRPVMGAIAARMSDFVIATADNPRTEDLSSILNEIEAGLREGPAGYSLIPDRREAIRSAFSTARKGDLVLLAGKGHEDCQIIGSRALPFDDRVVARELIQELIQRSVN